MKHYLYRSTMQRYTDFFAFLEEEKCPAQQIDLISMLWHAYSVSALLRSSYFEIIRIGDGWHTLIIQKYADESYSIKYTFNPNFANKSERFA